MPSKIHRVSGRGHEGMGLKKNQSPVGRVSRFTFSEGHGRQLPGGEGGTSSRSDVWSLRTGGTS